MGEKILKSKFSLKDTNGKILISMSEFEETYSLKYGVNIIRIDIPKHLTLLNPSYCSDRYVLNMYFEKEHNLLSVDYESLNFLLSKLIEGDDRVYIKIVKKKDEKLVVSYPIFYKKKNKYV